MLISKFDLYKPEWLELVFDNRNKDYGAYYLRQHYAGNMVKAMVITFSGVILLCGAGMMLSTKPVTTVQPPPPVIVTLTEIKRPVVPPKQLEQPRPIDPPKTTAYRQFVVASDEDIHTPPPDVTKITGAIGPVTLDGKDDVPNVVDNTPSGNGTATQPVTPDVSIHSTGELDEMPSPIGGEAAWSRFLNKNLRYPVPAQEEGLSGKVTLSFVIEKDGSLSNIVVYAPAGHGFDEEALRVLKMAKAWKPGKQNGQAVRVRYLIPINFQLADNN